MKHRFYLVVIILILMIGCSARRESAPSQIAATRPADSKPMAKHVPQSTPGTESDDVATNESGVITGYVGSAAPTTQKQPSSSNAQASTNIERKIIRNAELDLELANTQEGFNKISTLANNYGGYVVTSESKQFDEAGIAITITIRIPASKFDQAVSEIRGFGSRVIREKTSGQDVTEEFMDLEAQLKTKKALEDQYLEIMKRAVKIEDVLQVQQHLSEVRGEIEQMEGRRRYLENQAAFSTIIISLQPPVLAAKLNNKGFFYQFKEAIGDSITIAQELVLGLVRLLGVFIPLLIIFVLPLFFIIRYFIRKRSMQKS